MKIFSEKVKYGLAALFELAKNYNSGYLQIKDIASAQDIPQNYLEQLLIKLKDADLVKSTRGMKGGYKLNKPANTIKVIDLIEALEGEITIFETVEPSTVLGIYWTDIEDNFKELFNSTLEDFINEDNALHKRLFYHI